jgi:LuxR family maltose regulon positive regulatory protein
VKSGLLATKLHRPSTPPKRVPRPHLIQRLDEGLESSRQMTLVSAPAGFGKTTCISDWADTLDCPVTWLSLDAADDDPGRFFAYLVAALQTVDANLGREIEGALRSGQLPPSEVISATLINDILRAQRVEGRFLLVLDDFHVIQDPSILEVLEKLVANPPQPLHLVLLTREDPPLPLARLRAHNQLTEIRARDLRFASDDAERLLNEVLGLSLSPADVAALEAKTEGWVVGLQLAGLSIRDRADPSGFIATLSGSHRFILSYLTEEVLNRQPEAVQRFLLQTSILDKLNGDLCNAVTGRSDGRTLLERLFNANLFLIPLDDEGQWYRYHHLFADLLRDLQNTLLKEDTAELHERAAHWYAQAGGERTGERGAFVNEAMKHALAAEDYGLAVDLLERHAMDMIMQGYAKTVNGWVQVIPAEWTSSSPRTHLAFAWMHLLRGAYAQAAPYLERLEGSFSGSQVSQEESEALKAEWLVLQSLLLNMQGEMTESLALATQALEIAPEQDSRVRSLAYFGQAGAYQVMEEYGLVVDAYQMAIQHGREAKNLVTEMMSTSGLARLAFEHGQLHLAFEIAAPVSARLEGSGSLPPISTVIFGILGEVQTQWLQIDEARRHGRRALQLSVLGGYNSGIISLRVLLSRLSQLAGDLEDAAREIQKAVDLMQGDIPDYVRQEAVAQQVRVSLAQNRPAAADLALQGQGFSFQGRFSFPALPPDQSIPHSAGLLYNSSLRVLLYQARAGRDAANLRAGIELADRLITGALQGQTLLVALEALLLRAQMHAALGSTRASQVDYARALELAEPEGILGVFIEQGPPVAEALADLVEQAQLEAVHARYVERLLAAFSRLQPPSTARREQPPLDLPAGIEPVALIEPLTDRELDVLCLMAEGLKYKEIAERLFISLNTVRSHVKAIYGKLHVNNRTQAVTVARQLRML